MNGYKKQLEFLDWELGVFFHFGIRSFYKGHKDWDGKPMPLCGFNPRSLDTDSWIEAVKASGAKYAILTCKHHDGFALWPSEYTEYSVKNTPWKDGKGDVVSEFVASCRKYGIKVGLYYSPAQWGESAIPFSSARDYDDYFINQIGELLTNYGKIDYLWFDGCGSEGHEYDRERIVREIGRMQPDILTFCDPEWTPGARWIGNEDGYASLNNPLVVSSTDFSELSTSEQRLSSAKFLPAECDAKIRDTWFYDDNEDTLKSLDELFGMYEMSVGHGSNFLINIGPDDRGLLPEADKSRLLELGEKIRTSYGSPLNYTDIEKCGDIYWVEHKEKASSEWKNAKKEHLSNTLVIKESLENGQKINEFSVYAYLPHYQHKKILIFKGATIGHKLICRFSPIRASKFEVVVDGGAEHKISEIKAYYVG